MTAFTFVEVPPGFEPGRKGFADLCLTTWLWHRQRYILYQKKSFYASVFNMFLIIFKSKYFINLLVSLAIKDCSVTRTCELKLTVDRAGNEIMPFPLHKINFVAFARESLDIFPRNQRLLGHANLRVSILLVSRSTERMETR